jgi:phenylacetate-CoA ligase
VLGRIPFLTGGELLNHPEHLFCVPREELTHVIGTSGTTGPHKTIYLTADDMARQTRMLGTFYRNFPGVRRAVVWLLLEDESWAAGTITRDGFRQGEIEVTVMSTSRPVEEQLALLRRKQIDMIMSTPNYVHRVATESDTPVRTFGVKYICLAGTPFTETFRERMQQTWGAKVMDSYGGAETACGIASECRFQDGLHLTEVDYWMEIVDPDTGEPLPDGAEGEIVITTLSRRGMPLVRYRTGDLATLLPRDARCACGMPTRRMSRVRGRVDDMLILGSANVYPDEIDRAVRGVEGVTDCQLVVRRECHRDVIDLTVESGRAEPAMRGVLIHALRSIEYLRLLEDVGKVLVFGRVRVVPRGTLSRNRPKSVRVIDRREETLTGGTR